MRPLPPPRRRHQCWHAAAGRAAQVHLYVLRGDGRALHTGIVDRVSVPACSPVLAADSQFVRNAARKKRARLRLCFGRRRGRARCWARGRLPGRLQCMQGCACWGVQSPRAPVSTRSSARPPSPIPLRSLDGTPVTRPSGAADCPGFPAGAWMQVTFNIKPKNANVAGWNQEVAQRVYTNLLLVFANDPSLPQARSPQVRGRGRRRARAGPPPYMAVACGCAGGGCAQLAMGSPERSRKHTPVR